jgi:hypothetical protein
MVPTNRSKKIPTQPATLPRPLVRWLEPSIPSTSEAEPSPRTQRVCACVSLGRRCIESVVDTCSARIPTDSEVQRERYWAVSCISSLSFSSHEHLWHLKHRCTQRTKVHILCCFGPSDGRVRLPPNSRASRTSRLLTPSTSGATIASLPPTTVVSIETLSGVVLSGLENIAAFAVFTSGYQAATTATLAS